MAGPAGAYHTDLPTGRTPSLRSRVATSSRYSAASLIADARASLPPSPGRVAGSTARMTTTFAPGWFRTSSTAFGNTVSAHRDPSSTARILMSFNGLLHFSAPATREATHAASVTPHSLGVFFLRSAGFSNQ